MIFWILVEVITKQLDIARAGKRKPETILTTISRHREVLCFEMTERFSWSAIFFIKRSQRSGEKKNLRGRKWVQNWQLLDFDMSSLLHDLATKSLKQTLAHDRSAEAVKSKTAGCTLMCYCLSCCSSWLKLLCLWAKS